MAQRVQDIMTGVLVTVEPQASVGAVARMMRDRDVGAVLVTEDGRLRALVSDRDLVVRALADGEDPERTTIARACSEELVTVSPDDTLDRAVSLMREHSVRRLPVVGAEDEPVGIVSLGDLAIERDEKSALGDISAARPNT
ncbi:CBS domain-containing protein [Streptomyces bicolor]|uniref:CBS domain-containing protein n=1 Tax=Streptomyces bicolor TaxID=66874 RepID=UPI0004E1776D|nr:CBS domain-containing protein [Streptomyces bicolor]